MNERKNWINEWLKAWMNVLKEFLSVKYQIN